jgi:signal transduction histidine kinase
MSDKSEKPMGLPPYYWAKPPVKPTRNTKGFVNKQQKWFFIIRVGLLLAKVAAAAALVLLIVTRF